MNKHYRGICGVLKNDEKEDEIAYRIIETSWGNGFGTEITKGLIDYCFLNMKLNLITADVCVDNVKSVKILNKYFKVKKEFFNAEDNLYGQTIYFKKRKLDITTAKTYASDIKAFAKWIDN